MSDATRTSALLRRVAWRLRLASIGRNWLRALIALVAVYAAALVLSRLLGLFPFPQAEVALAALPIVAAVAALAWHRRATPAAAARRVDLHGGTKDLFLTVVLLDGTAGEYGPLVVRDAERRAASIAPRQVVPLPWERGTLWAGALVALSAASVFFLPPLDPFGNVAEANEEQTRREELTKTREETARRVERLTTKQDASEGEENSDAVKKAVEGLKAALNKMKPAEKQTNAQALQDRQKDLGGKWQKLNAEQLKDLMAQTAKNQQFGGADREKLEKWTRELQEGSTESLRKELDELKDALQRLASEKDPVEREEMAQQLKKRLKDLEEFASERTGSKPLSAALQRAMKQLELARKEGLSAEATDAAQQSLDLTKLELKEIAQSAKDLQALEEALKVIQMAKKVNEGEGLDGEVCRNCVSLDDYAELYAEMMGGEQPGEGMGAEGFGEGGAAEEDDSVETGFKTERSESPITAGKVLLSLKTKGLSDRGDAVKAYRDGLSRVKQGVSEALEQEQIPPGYHEGIKSYFDTIRAPDAPETEPAEGPATSE